MYFLALDVGSSSTRAILYDAEGCLVHKSQHTLTTYYPQPGWVEHDPEDIWAKTCLAMRAVLAKVNIADVGACGITNQRETTIIWDKNLDKCLGPAISWQDRRTDECFAAFSADELDLIQSKTGLIPNAYFTATKLQWLLNNQKLVESTLAREGLAFGTVDSFLLWRLTKGAVHATDVSNASRTLLFNIENCSWDYELLEMFSIPKSILPEVLDNDAYFGDIHRDFCGRSIPITAMVGDQQASLIGQSCIEEGMMKSTYGSGAFLLLNTGTNLVRSEHLLSTIAYRVKNETFYSLEGSIYQAGTILKWLRNELKFIKNFADSERCARNVQDNAGVYFLPSFTSLGAPHWITPPGALITGLSLGASFEHIVRAALEAVAYQTHDIIRCIHEDVEFKVRVLHADGGMAQNTWFLSFLSSVCNLTVRRPKELETTALGAAMLAAVGCGYYSSLSAAHKYWTCGGTFEPLEQRDMYEKYYQGWVDVVSSVKDSRRSFVAPKPERKS